MGLAHLDERLTSALGKETPIFDTDSVPFLAMGFDGAKKLYPASTPALNEVPDEDGLHFLYSCPWSPKG